MRNRRRRKIAIRKHAIQFLKPSGTYETSLRLDTGETLIIRDSFENLIRELNSPLNTQVFITCHQIIDETDKAEGDNENV